ncbi:TPA: MFS transporter [Salmonella enterica]|uniref:MFS transporter n=4 Tax=Enterobacteriaceae TaxID=543 RepID=A0A5Y2QGC9_SALER|nr:MULTISPECIES: MFS transporter [Enterobacteriaceae]ECF4921635.1 MFS transporter [Salmonella enterica subsp. arizonae]ECG1333324.1 MFS transporter [Salmonella enterica subsp. indica]EEM2500361.1 MFS transporter [Salmonella enterica subsp. indica serovar 45:a:e,n,x]HAE8196518.1 MFS transporter [Salmonella enterica subsp. indica serovar 41:b:1,7]ECI9860441.1 MFS transporter [Salmonella enterica subsp. arizonae]
MSIAGKKTHARYYILFMITLVLTLATGDRATLSVAGPEMQKELGISAVEIGYLFSAFSWAYVISMTPAGWVADKVGSKRAMFLGILLWSVMTVFMGLVSYVTFVVPALLILRFLLGVCESPVGPSAGRIIAAWFPSQERGVAGAIFNSAQYASLAIFTPLMAWLCHAFGWDHVFIVMGVIGIIIAFCWSKFFYVPTKHPGINHEEMEYLKEGGALVELDTATHVKGERKRAGWQEIGQLFKSRMLIGIFIGQYCISAITWFFMTWFPIYLVKERGMSILQAGFMASVPAICGLVGGIMSGFFSDWLLRKTNNLSLARKVPITIGLTMSASMILCNYVGSEALVMFLMSAAFFGKGFGSLGWAVVADTAPKEIIGTTGGLFNSLGNIAGIVTPVVIGYILQETGSFANALVFVGTHGIIAVCSYWFIVGKIERLKIAPRDDDAVPMQKREA